MPTYDISPTFTTATARNVSTYKVVLPFSNCNEINDGGLLDDRSEGYNCTRCPNDKEYAIPVFPTDNLYFQFNFPDYRNTDVTNPTKGWRDATNSSGSDWYVGAGLLDACSGTPVSAGDIDIYSTDYGAHYVDGMGSIQTAVIDASMLATIGVDCFYFSFFYKKADGSIEYFYTENFRMIRLCQDGYLELEGIYPEGATDCFGYLYGDLSGYPGVVTGTPEYRNITRVEAYTRYQGETSQVDRDFDGDVSRTLITTNTALVSSLVAPYHASKINRQVMSGPVIEVDEGRFLVDALSEKNTPENLTMFQLRYTLFNQCDQQFGC
jgi:hypothetical protein